MGIGQDTALSSVWGQPDMFFPFSYMSPILDILFLHELHTWMCFSDYMELPTISTCISLSSIRIMQFSPPALCSYNDWCGYSVNQIGIYVFLFFLLPVFFSATSAPMQPLRQGCWLRAVGQIWEAGQQDLGKQTCWWIWNLCFIDSPMCYWNACPIFGEKKIDTGSSLK